MLPMKFPLHWFGPNSVALKQYVYREPHWNHGPQGSLVDKAPLKMV